MSTNNMSSNIPFTSMPSEDPFVTTSGQPSFMTDLLASRSKLFRSKEVDSGIIYTETPSPPKCTSTAPSATSDEQSVVYTPEGSINADGPPTSVGQLLGAGADDQDQVVRLLAEHFRLTQQQYPRCALLFVGNLPAVMNDVEIAWALRGQFSGCGVFVSRKVWHKPTALVHLPDFRAAVAAVRTTHVLAGRLLRVVHSRHAFF